LNRALSTLFGVSSLQKSLSPPRRKRKANPQLIKHFAPIHTDIVGIVGSKDLFWDQDFITDTYVSTVSRPNRISFKSTALIRQSSSTSLWALDELSKWSTTRLPNMIASASSLQTSVGVSRFWPRFESGSSLTRDDLSSLQVIGQVDGKFIACILRYDDFTHY
jgi:hypothetical protein